MKNDQHLPPQAPAPRKKVYVSPELQEWGSILDLTRGKKAAELQDSPGKGGGSNLT